MHRYRTHHCNELTASSIGQRVRLSGWIHNRRDHGGVLFIDLRDNYGLTQIVIPPTQSFQNEVAHLPKETVVRFDGAVRSRGDENFNPKLKTGEVEIVADAYEVLGKCAPLPFSIFPEEPQPEELRQRYRFLDLRRSELHQNIIMRCQVVSSLRRRMMAEGFNEFTTPILTSSSPEGARDYLVPSRLHPGQFYALPQAPQMFKQLIMVSGFDRYFQIAPCFRDEDPRADRAPGEFYQLDLEMSFVEQDDVFQVVERVIGGVFEEFSAWKVDKAPFVRIPYKEALLKYGSDKPDLRNPLTIVDVTPHFKSSGFKAFASVVEGGGVVRALAVKGIADKPRSFFDRLVEYAQSLGAKGLAYLVWGSDQVKGPIGKFLSKEELDAIARSCAVGAGDVVFFIADKERAAWKVLGELRTKLGVDLELIEKNTYRFCWIVDFPMYDWDEETKAVVFSHNPFSMPQGGLEALETKKPLEILAYQYDLVCNGIELSSGAIRNHRPEVMYRAFEIVGYSQEDVENKFRGMINALKFGAPPHGGIAPGVDRIVMLLADQKNIREVILFPMNQRAQDLMMNAPSEVSEKQLKELHLTVTKVGEKK